MKQSEPQNLQRGVNIMRCPRRRKNPKGCIILGIAALFGAVLCISFFSVKAMLLTIAVLLIVLGIFLLRL